MDEALQTGPAQSESSTQRRHPVQIATFSRVGVTFGQHTRYYRTEFEVQLPHTGQLPSTRQRSIPAAQYNRAVFAFGSRARLSAPYLRLTAGSRIKGAQPYGGSRWICLRLFKTCTPRRQSWSG
jgi:hypothetical protein